MQGGRPPQPSGTNRPSSSACPSHGRSRGVDACARCAAPRARWDHPRRQNAPRRPAAMAGEAHPVPSRTRKLSPRAPIVLRVQPVGDQDAAGRLGAFSPREGPRAERGAPLFCAGVLVDLSGSYSFSGVRPIFCYQTSRGLCPLFNGASDQLSEVQVSLQLFT